MRPRLALSDRRNVEWRGDVTVADRRLGDVQLAMGHVADAPDRYLRAAAAIRPIAAAAPTAMVWQQDVAKVETGLAAAELAAGRLDAARAAATSAERVVLPHFQRRPDADLGMLLGATRLVAAEIAAASGQTASARALRERALEVVRSVPGVRVIGACAVEARALLALGRIDEARPIVTELERRGYRHHLLIRAWRPHADVPRR